MNHRQKIVIRVCFFIFIGTVLYVPEEYNLIVGGAYSTFIPKTKFLGFVLITDLTYEIALKVLLIEWFAICVLFVAGFFLFKSNENIK
jgi:hypothetical protein